MDRPKRKIIRLQGYDYSQNGAYFITICTHERALLFDTVGADFISARDSISARMIADVFERTIEQYKDVSCPKYVVMPNHFHAIIVIERDYASVNNDGCERADIKSAPTISDVIQAFKRNSTVEYIRMVNQGILPPFNKRIWQRSFHDHIIRSEKEFQQIWDYIENNPYNWKNDCFYIV